jgi:hypothetical protein
VRVALQAGMTQTFDLADEAGRRFLAVAGLVFDFLSITNLSLSDFKGYHKHDPISSMRGIFSKTPQRCGFF